MIQDKPIPSESLDWLHPAGVADRLLAQVEAGIKKKDRSRRRMGTAATLVAVAFVAFWGVPYVRDTSTVATVAVHRQTLVLSDGSVADLNARTSLHTDFRYGRRVLRLEHGEAFFSVAKDVNHPFLVETPAGTVRVTGTKFNVRLAEEGHVEVTLLEGSVLFAASGSRPENSALALGPGQQLSTEDSKTALHTLDAAELDAATAWRRGRVLFDNLNLAQAAARMAAYHGISIEVPASLASLHLGGSSDLDNLKGFLQAIQDALPVSVLNKPDGSYRLVPR